MQQEENNIESPKAKKRSVWKILRNGFIGLLLFIILVMLLLRITAIQTYLANQFAQYLSKNTQTQITIGRLDIHSFLKVDLFDLYVIDQQDSVMVNSKQISIDMNMFALAENKLLINQIYIDSTYFALRDNKVDSMLNLNKIIDFFVDKNSPSDTSSSNLKIELKRLDIRGAHYVMDLRTSTNFDDGGMNYSHLDVKDVDLSISDFTMVGDTMYGNLEQLKALEKCGFNLQQFGGIVKLSSAGLKIDSFHFRTPSSWFYADFEMRYNRWQDWLEFIDDIRFRTRIDSAQLNMEDIQFFAPSMKGMQDTLRLSGKVRGPISNLKLRKGRVFFKRNTRFIGDITMTGLPDLEHSFMLIKAKDLRVNYNEIKQFYLPSKKQIPIPEFIKELGDIRINGRFTGFYNDFVSNASFHTKQGLLTTDILIKPHHNQESKIEYHGRFSTKAFHLGFITGSQNYGGVDMTASIDGIGLDKGADANYKIDISSIYISKYNYKGIRINGNIKNARIDSRLEAADKDFTLAADGYVDLHDSLPEYQLSLNIDNARIARLFLLDKDTLGKISGLVNIKMKGNTIDNIYGSLSMDSIIYQVQDTKYIGDSLRLKTSYDENDFRQITLTSKWVDADVEGQFLFSEIGMMYKIVFNNIVPSIIKSWGIKNVDQIDKSDVKESDYLKFDVNIKNPVDFSKLFLPKSDFSKGTLISGYFNLFHDSMNLDIYAPKIKYDSYYAEELNIRINKPPHELNLMVDANYLHAKEKFRLDSVLIRSNIQEDTVIYYAQWGTKNNHQNGGHLGGEIVWEGSDSLSIQFAPGEIWLNDTLWQISDLSHITYAPHYLHISEFKISTDESMILANGSISEKPNDILKIEFNHFDLSLLDIYTIEKYSTNLDGHLTGQFEISNLWTSPGFSANMEISNFYLNESFLGNTTAHSLYSRSRDAFAIDVVMQNPKDSIPIKYLDLGGFFYPKRDSNNYDLDLYFNHFPLQSLQSYLTSFTSDIYGFLDGKVSLEGTFDEPILDGKVKADVPRLKIDYIGETYHFKDDFTFTKDYFGLDNVYIYDNQYKGGKRHRALANVQIRHQNFNNFELYVDVKPEDISVLNLEKNEEALFYGKAIGSGEFLLEGPFNALKMKMNLESKDGSKISIPFSSETIATQADFITFIKKDDTLNTKAVEVKDDDFSFEMDMNIKVKPSTQIEIVMDDVVGDIITARGSGDIRLTYDKDEVFMMFGKYSIERGDYLFTMQNIINKHFYIKPGGFLEWNGEMETAKINLVAVYKTEAKLYDLLQQVDQSEEFKKRASKVLCIIKLSGSLYDPNVSFDIQVPEESSATRQLVHQLLTLEGAGGSQEMNKNFISLLVLSRFMPPSGYDSGTNPDALSKNATEMVANQVGNVLNKLSDDVEIGLNWNPGDELTTQEVAIALSYSMLDDRLVIDGKFGTGGGSTEAGSAHRIVGDLNVEYKFTKDGRIRGKVFNRTNYYDPLTKRAPYTQGVGIAYRKEFDNLYELFHKTQAEKDQIKRSEESAKYRKEMRKIRKEKRQKRKRSRKNKKETPEKPKSMAIIKEEDI